MTKRTALAATLLLVASPAAAQTATYCVNCTTEWTEIGREAARAAQVVQQINNQLAQLVQLRNTFAAISHGNLAAIADLGPELGGLGLSNPLGDTGIGDLAQSLGGLAAAGGTTGALAANLMRTDQFYLPSIDDFRMIALQQGAQAAASQKALAMVALQSSDARLQALTTLRSRLDDNARDVTAASQGTMRLAGETAVAVAQTNQLLAAGMMQQAQAATRQAQEDQRWACETKAFANDQDESIRRLKAGDRTPVASTTGACAALAANSPTSPVVTALLNPDGSTPSLADAIATPDDGTTLSRMTSTSWGAQAAANATAAGINPTAVAATCLMESGCSANVGGSGTISGAFQMSNGTYAQTVAEVQASNPALAAQITSKNDPASQSIAAAQYLKDAAASLQNSGIANPTVLDGRSYYNFGPSYGAQVATAPDSASMAATLSGMSDATLRANGISSTTTVGQWRASVITKIGSAASQPILLGRSA